MLKAWLQHWHNALLQPHKLRAADVLDERIRLESISTAIGATGVMAIACVMYIIFPRDLPEANLMGVWLITQLGIGVLWLAFIAGYLHYRHPLMRQWWSYLSTLVCSFYGLIWGVGWVYFVGDADMAHAQSAVTFTLILGGVFTGGLLATIFHLPSLLSFTLCSLLPALFSTFIHQGIFHQWFGVSLVVYMLACSAFSLNLHSFLMETLQQREDKASLAQQLTIEKQRAEQASQDKTRFLASVSHDLRQPLQALEFFQHGLAAALPQHNTTEQRILDKMETCITTLKELLNAMLDVSRLETGHLVMQKRVFPLNDLLQRVYQQYESIAAESDLLLHYAYTSVFIESDPTQLERILRNLVDNAIKHMGKSTQSQQGRILLGVRRKGNHLNIEVWDNGIGIPKHEQQAIFQEFYQLNNPERKRERGIGLGLAIIKRTSAALGHELSLSSQPNQGTVFRITVPRVLAAHFSNTGHNGDQAALPLNYHSRILIIEDDQAVAEALQTLLALWRYPSVIGDASDPTQIFNHHPDISFIISDYQLSADIDGIQIIQQIRRQANRDIPALLITGNTTPELADRLKIADIPVSYKPISPLQLRQIIEKSNMG